MSRPKSYVEKVAERRLISIQEAADLLGLNHRVIRRRIADGTLTGYRIANTRAIRVDAAEVNSLAQPIPAVSHG